MRKFVYLLIFICSIYFNGYQVQGSGVLELMYSLASGAAKSLDDPSSGEASSVPPSDYTVQCLEALESNFLQHKENQTSNLVSLVENSLPYLNQRARELYQSTLNELDQYKTQQLIQDVLKRFCPTQIYSEKTISEISDWIYSYSRDLDTVFGHVTSILKNETAYLRDEYSEYLSEVLSNLNKTLPIYYEKGGSLASSIEGRLCDKARDAFHSLQKEPWFQEYFPSLASNSEDAPVVNSALLMTPSPIAPPN
jgi:hypothetical protein